MADTSYNYSVSTDFKNQAVANGVLYEEIVNSTIASASILRVDVSGDDCSIWFNDPLSSGDETTLDGLVSVHDGMQQPAQVFVGSVPAAGNEAVRISGSGRFDGGVRVVTAATPDAPSVVPSGATGSTSWGYRVTAVSDVGETLASAETLITNGVATLSTVNFNKISWAEVIGARTYNVYRSTSGGTPGSTGLIATVMPGQCHINDIGLSASGSVPSANSTGRILLGSDSTVLIDRDASGNLIFSDVSGSDIKFSTSTTPPVDVTKSAASAGTDKQAAKRDHKHNISTAAPVSSAVQVGNAAGEGAATSVALSDHQHEVTRGTPTGVGTANAAGTATSFAGSDHVHSGLKRDAGDFNSFTAKTSPSGSDILLIEDAADGNNKKKVTVNQLQSTSDYASAVSEGSSTTTSSTYQDKTTLTTGALTGDFVVFWQCGISIAAQNKRELCRLYNSTDAVILGEDDNQASVNGAWKLACGFALVTLTGTSKTFKIQFASYDNASTVTVRRARIVMWRVP